VNLALIEPYLQDKIYFRMSNAFSLHSTIYPLLDIWNANKGLVKDTQEFQLPDSEIYFCVSRKELSPTVSFLDYGQYILLKLISDGTSLVKLAELGNEYGFESKLMSFIQQGWIAGFIVKG